MERSLLLSALLVPEHVETKHLEVCPPNSLKKWKKRRGIDEAEDSPKSKCNKGEVEELPNDASNGTESLEEKIHFEVEPETIEYKLQPGIALRIPEPTPASAHNRVSLRSSQGRDENYWNDLDKDLKNDTLLSLFPKVLFYKC